ncbi:pseudouridine synthase [Leptospira ryugenii]|uniref:Pseudouridine synthase n=1 Tax=Leptospira ryugenii TaxID=1917863 RepID=A0A2P2DY55_9LEPT|nr:RluA family pseudouridine synthase [Leptospira ryugenii]GBF49574.1 pseudouridine synthase [Leptospira ryugenii]
MKPYSSFVPEKYHNFPILEYLHLRFPYYSASDWGRHCHEGRVKRNGYVLCADDFVLKGDLISYTPEDKTFSEPTVNAKYKILYDSHQFLIVDKPANLPVHPAGKYRTQTLLNFLKADLNSEEIFPVHRLDRETSGIMVFAKNKEWQLYLQSAFEKRLVKKEYEVLVYGKFPIELEAIGFIGKEENSIVRKKQKYSPYGFPNSKESETHFSLIHYSQEKDISHLKVYPRTGRVHQIRATLYSLGYPVLGDKLYGKDESFFLSFAKTGDTSGFVESLGHTRQALHATYLEFGDNVSDHKYSFHLPFPDELSLLLN